MTIALIDSIGLTTKTAFVFFLWVAISISLFLRSVRKMKDIAGSRTEYYRRYKSGELSKKERRNLSRDWIWQIAIYILFAVVEIAVFATEGK